MAMHYLDLYEKELIYDAIAYYATHALKNSTKEHKEFVLENAKSIYEKLYDDEDIVALTEGDDMPNPSEKPAQKAVTTPQELPTPHPQAIPRPPTMTLEQWEKLIKMGLTGLEEYPFVD